MPSTYTLGIGIIFESEFKLNKNTIIRPYSINYNYVELRDKTRTQSEYGFICSLSELITFELESEAKDAKSAAISAWNNQWALVFLSVIIRKPLYFPILKFISLKQNSESFILTDVNFGHEIFNDPYNLSNNELDK